MPRGRGLPKKYAKMGFKKGWAAYKKFHKLGRAGLTGARVKPKPRKRGNPGNPRRSVSVAKNKKKGKSSKSGIVSLARGGMYIAAFAVPARIAYDQAPGTQAQKAAYVVQAYAGVGIDGRFSWDVVKQMYTPIVAWTIVDWVLGKFGVWRKVGRLLRM